MEEQLKEALSTLMAAAASASEFVAAQAPDVVNQAMVWYATKSLAMCLLGVLAIGMLVALDRWVFLVLKDHFKNECARLGMKYNPMDMWKDVDFVVGYVLTGSLARLFLYTLTASVWINFEWLMIWLAPKLWLMEKAAELIK